MCYHTTVCIIIVLVYFISTQKIMMSITKPKPFADEVFQILETLGLPIIHNTHELLEKFYNSTATLREHLLKQEHGNPRPRLSEVSFMEITSKYRLDALGTEVPQIANQLAMAIGSAKYYLPYTSNINPTYMYGRPDLLFWYHIDFGYRLASSGWDRIAFLLDLGFDLNTSTNCDYPTVLRLIPKNNTHYIKNQNFIHLKEFRDGRFHELEGKRGEGARNETTHLISRSTRYFLELIENFREGKSAMIAKRENEIQILFEHHEFFLKGIENSLNLISSHWPKEVSNEN